MCIDLFRGCIQNVHTEYVEVTPPACRQNTMGVAFKMDEDDPWGQTRTVHTEQAEGFPSQTEILRRPFSGCTHRLHSEHLPGHTQLYIQNREVFPVIIKTGRFSQSYSKSTWTVFGMHRKCALFRTKSRCGFSQCLRACARAYVCVCARL